MIFEPSAALVDLDFIRFILEQAALSNTIANEDKFKSLLEDLSLKEAQMLLNRGNHSSNTFYGPRSFFSRD